MPTKQIKTFRNVQNDAILNVIRGKASNEYRSRVPQATQANMEAVTASIMEHNGNRNEFVDALVNQIGDIISRSFSWTNPLGKFKIGMLAYGETIEEYYVGLVEAKTYDAARSPMEEAIFGQEDNEVQSTFHKIVRQEYYKVTVNDLILKRAFLSDTGLSRLVSDIMASAANSNELDEFLQMCQLFQEYAENEGFFKVNVPNVSATASTTEQSKAFLRRVHEMIYKLQFPTRHYNASGMYVAAKPEELELFITPEAKAAIDIEAFASLFNVGLAEINSRITIIPREYWGIGGAQALLTVKDFFVVADTLHETRQADNPVGLYRNYFLHIHQILSFSRFVPAVLFTTQPGTVIESENPVVADITGIDVFDRDGVEVTTIERGDFYDVKPLVTMHPADAREGAVELTLIGAEHEKTFLRQTGTLFVPHEEKGRLFGSAVVPSLQITARAVDFPEQTVTVNIPLTGDVLNLWPREDR